MGQGTETTRHRRKKRGNLFYTAEFHVSDHFSVDRINSCIQHNCARHYHIGGKSCRFSRNSPPHFFSSCDASKSSGIRQSEQPRSISPPPQQRRPPSSATKS